MTDTTNRRRVPGGVSGGGRFATEQKAESLVSLQGHRAGKDTRTGFIAANPVRGHQQTELSIRPVHGQAAEVLTYTAGDGAQVLVLPDEQDRTVGKVLDSLEIDDHLYGSLVSGSRGLSSRIEATQDARRQRNAADEAGIPAVRGTREVPVFRDEGGRWEIHFGDDQVVLNPYNPAKSGIRTAPHRPLTSPLAGGPELDRMVAGWSGKPGDTAAALMGRLEGGYRRMRTKAGLG